MVVMIDVVTAPCRAASFVAQGCELAVARVDDGVIAVHVEDPRRDVGEQRLEPLGVVVGVAHAPGKHPGGG